jgi:hypothetical protein
MNGVHFKYEIIPAGRWSRLEGTTAKGGDNEPRPHFVPTTDRGRQLLHMEISRFFGRTGLCPGQITLEDGATEYAYRFINLPEAEAVSLLDQLDEMIHQLKRDWK